MGIARHYDRRARSGRLGAGRRPGGGAFGRLALESRAAMDLLEYQGKQLFARHGLRVSSGRPVTTVEDALKAAEEVGYPVVVKDQVLVGGRGKAGGVKLAANAEETATHAGNILGMDIHGHTVHTLWIEHASDIETEYY